MSFGPVEPFADDDDDEDPDMFLEVNA